MTELIKEQISAIIDGEMESKSCGTSIKSEEFKQTWIRYHLISDCFHNRIPEHHDLSLSQKISESIQLEPTILAPTPKTFVKYAKPLAGIAVAASVAAMAIFGIQQIQSPQQILTTQPAPLAQVQLPQAPMEYGVPLQLPELGEARPVQVQMQSDMRINRYLLNHNEYRTSMGVGGVTPHVHMVATGSE